MGTNTAVSAAPGMKSATGSGPNADARMDQAIMSDAIREREHLEETAALALEFGKSLMQAGSSGRHVENVVSGVADVLGAERANVCVGYSSITITIGLSSQTITRMCAVGSLGVNERMYRALSGAAGRIGQKGSTVIQARDELRRVLRETRAHPSWLVALAVGVGCAAFGRLMGADLRGVGPILVAAALAQTVRRQFFSWNVNVFVSAAAIAFVGSSLCGFASRWSGSQTLPINMVATVLLLVPGVPVFNAQYDVLDGRPALGSARAIWAVVIMVFMTTGLWLAQILLGATP